MELLKRLYQIAKSYSNSAFEDLLSTKGLWKSPLRYQHTYYHEAASAYSYKSPAKSVDPELAGYYANLEIPYGSNLMTVKAAWKHLLKKYHPDLHSNDPEKRQIATVLTQKLNEAYHAIEKAINENRV